MNNRKLTMPVPFDPVKHWPEPDMSLLNPVRPSAPALSPSKRKWIYGPWAEWIETAATVKGAPYDYVALGLLVASSSLIGNARWSSPWDGWEEPPVIWGMLVGNPSAGKSPALDAILSPLREIESALADTFNSAFHDWETENQLAKIVAEDWKLSAKDAVKNGGAPPTRPANADAGPKPLRERVYVIDTTTEKMAELMSQTTRGLLAFRDELSGWLGSMDRYSDGGDRPFWLESFGGRTFTVDRKSTPHPIVVDRLSVAVLGGIQPDKLSGLLIKSADDGLLARFIVVYPQPVPVKRPTVSLDTKTLKLAFERLHGLPPSQDESGKSKPYVLPFTSEAADEIQAFRKQCQEWEAEAEGLYLGHIGKLPGMVVRITCILAHLDWATQSIGRAPSELSAEHVLRACYLAGEYFRRHAQRAYGHESVSREVRAACRVASLIRTERLSRLTAREVQRRGLFGLDTAKAVQAALGFIAELGWGRWETEKTGGHPRHVFIVSPRVFSASVPPTAPSDTMTKDDKSFSSEHLSGSVNASPELTPFPPLPGLNHTKPLED